MKIRGSGPCSGAGSALFEECVFIDNQAERGGAITFSTDWVASELTIDTCDFEGNFAAADGSCLAIFGT